MSKIEEARDILDQLGLPSAQQNDISCLTLLALCGLSEGDHWSQASKPSRRIHEILEYMGDTFGRDYAENTRENVRRQVIHQLMQAGVAARNPDIPDLPTNSPRTHYGLTDEVLSPFAATSPAPGNPSCTPFSLTRALFAKNIGVVAE